MAAATAEEKGKEEKQKGKVVFFCEDLRRIPKGEGRGWKAETEDSAEGFSGDQTYFFRAGGEGLRCFSYTAYVVQIYFS